MTIDEKMAKLEHAHSAKGVSHESDGDIRGARAMCTACGRWTLAKASSGATWVALECTALSLMALTRCPGRYVGSAR
jgi:hypothetical protein